MTPGGKITLSSEQLQKLQDGEEVQTSSDHHQIVTIHPPCEEVGHNWGRTRVVDQGTGNSDDSIVFQQRCTVCNTTRSAEIEDDSVSWSHP